MFNFIKNFIGVKTDKAVQSGVEALVRWDPKAATEAELRTMEQHLDTLGQEVAKARISFDKEKREADAIKTLSNQRLAAAEKLQIQAAETTDPARKTSLEASLTQLLKMLEEMAPDIKREVQDVDDAQALLTQLEEAYKTAGTKLKQARGELERAERSMARAEQDRAMAERKAEAARQASGLASSTSGLNTALAAMRESAERDLVAADAAKAKAGMLTPTKPEQDDPNIVAAMSSADPTPEGLTDRLAAIKAKLGKS